MSQSNENNVFGSALRAARQKANVTLDTIARALCVSVPYLSDVERGNRAPLSDEKIALAANVLGVPERALLVAAAHDRGWVDVRGLSPADVGRVIAFIDGLRASRNSG